MRYVRGSVAGEVTEQGEVAMLSARKSAEIRTFGYGFIR